jgi:mitochondrial fission protein ELM1
MANTQDIWVLTDDRAGNRSQALGVAEALGLPYVAKEIGYGPWARLPNVFLGGATLLGIDAASRERLTPPWPALVIAAGRRTAPVALAIKRASGGRSRLVQVMHPGAGSGGFDLVCVPRHDPECIGGNVIAITGAPHGLTAEKLSEARARWLPELTALTEPRIAVIVGGSTRRRPFTAAMATELGERVSAMASSVGGSLMVTTSRRTGEAADALLAAISAPARLHRWGDEGDNPYTGFLATADQVVVTGDSVSMCSEACAVPVPVQIFAPPALITEKHARCHASLYEGGYAHPFSGEVLEGSHEPLNAAIEIARAIRERGPQPAE